MNYIFVHLVFGVCGEPAASASIAAASLTSTVDRVDTVELRAVAERTLRGFTPKSGLRIYIR